jgi:hypothetical protein
MARQLAPDARADRHGCAIANNCHAGLRRRRREPEHALKDQEAWEATMANSQAALRPGGGASRRRGPSVRRLAVSTASGLALLVAVAGAARAQSSTAAQPPQRALDANGVDLVSGVLSYAETQVLMPGGIFSAWVSNLDAGLTTTGNEVYTVSIGVSIRAEPRRRFSRYVSEQDRGAGSRAGRDGRLTVSGMSGCGGLLSSGFIGLT